MRYFLLVLAFVFMGLCIAFFSLNAGDVTLNYYFDTAHIHLPFLLIIAGVIGTVLGAAVFSLPLFSLARRNRRLRIRAYRAEQELLNLRTLPMRDSYL